MEKHIIDDLKTKFNEVINNVPKRKQSELLNELTSMRRYLDKYDFFLLNWAQEIGYFLSKDIIDRMQKTVVDILDNFNKYTPEDQAKVKEFLTSISIKYVADRAFLDKILDVLRFS